MNKALLSGIVFLLAFGAKAQTADEIIANHLEAMGGEAWETIKTMRMEATVTTQSAPGIEIHMAMTVVHNRAAKVEVSMMNMTQQVCVNGDKGWAINPFEGKEEAEPLSADQIMEMKDMTDLRGSLHNNEAKGYSVEYLGTENLDGKEVHKIKIEKSVHKTEYVLINPENWYQIKNITVATVDGKETTTEILYSNFKKVGGVVYPYTITQNDATMGNSVTSVKAIKLNESLDEKIFEMPVK